MRFAHVTLPLAGLALAATAAVAQYPQPYNSQDPQNYASPAAQSYQQQQANQPYNPDAYQQQGQYQGPPQGQYQGPPQGQYQGQQQGQYQGQQQGQYQDDQNYQLGQQAINQQYIDQAPPPLQDQQQPDAPGGGYMWTPGYWAFGPAGYYWVPGAWVEPPYQGALWTPGYWGDADAGYFWNAGYWGSTVGFYGGIDYGFGYFGSGFYGGYWNGGNFFYNRAYWNVGRFGRYGYTQRFNGVGGVHPGGSSFVHVSAGAGGFRGGAYNQHGFNTQSGNRGFQGQPGNYNHAVPAQGGSAYAQRPGQPAGAYNGGYNRSAPGINNQTRPVGSYGQAPGNYSHATAPQGYSAPRQSAPASSAPRQSAPSGGGGGSHASAPSGGGRGR